MRGQQLVLIDTAGASPRDPDLARRLRLMNQANASIETALVLPASTQAGAIDEVMKRFALAQPTSCVITKVDEAVSLGGMLSALVRTSCRWPTSATDSACPKICSPRARIRW